MASNNRLSNDWTVILEPKSSWYHLGLKEVWKYKDLWGMFVKRDFVTYYKQTILGPLWFLIQPLLTTIIYFFVFNRVANLSTDGLPGFIFYLAGITMWTYFADCLNKVSVVFSENKHIFSKVYFPRLVVPLSIVTSNLIKFGFQFLLFLAFYTYYLTTTDSLQPQLEILLLPVYIVIMAGIALGSGMIISSLTTKYRDLIFLLQFGVQLLMYGTPIIYPLSSIPDKYAIIIKINPLTSIIEAFRYSFLGTGAFDWLHLAYSGCSAIVLLGFGLIIFNRTNRSFIDTV